MRRRAPLRRIDSGGAAADLKHYMPRSRHWGKRSLLRRIVLGLFLLVLASGLLLILIPRFTLLPGTILVDPDFATLAEAGGGSPWQRVGEGRVEAVANGVRLVNDDHGQVAGLDQVIRIPPGTAAFRLTALVTLEDVVPGPERWQQARVIVQARPQNVPYYFHGRSQLVDRQGSFGPQQQRAIFWVDERHGDARLMLRLQHATGSLTVQNLQIEALAKSAERTLLRSVLIGTWLAVGAAMAAWLSWHSQNRLAAAIALGGLAVIGAAILFPTGARQPLHDLLDEWSGSGHLALVKPLVHVLGFACFAFASRLALPQIPLRLALPVWLAASATLELSEHFWGHFDSGDLVDMALNVAGASAGLWAAATWRRLRHDQRNGADRAAGSHAYGFRRWRRPRAWSSP
jgi:hypothetical protein